MPHLVRVAVADSGINPNYAAAQPVEAGVGVRVEASAGVLDTQWQDEIGHGTAVAATIRGRAPDALLFPVRIFRRRLIAPVTALIAAIDWASEHEIQLLNLSLGVTKLQWRDTFVDAVERAAASGVLLVSAAESEKKPCIPGILPGVVGVVADADLPQEQFAVSGDRVRASTWARELPLLSKERNLAGASLAVAHVTGELARWFSEEGPQSEEACRKHFARIQASAAP